MTYSPKEQTDLKSTHFPDQRWILIDYLNSLQIHEPAHQMPVIECFRLSEYLKLVLFFPCIQLHQHIDQFPSVMILTFLIKLNRITDVLRIMFILSAQRIHIEKITVCDCRTISQLTAIDTIQNLLCFLVLAFLTQKIRFNNLEKNIPAVIQTAINVLSGITNHLIPVNLMQRILQIQPAQMHPRSLQRLSLNKIHISGFLTSAAYRHHNTLIQRLKNDLAGSHCMHSRHNIVLQLIIASQKILIRHSLLINA